MKPRFSWRLAAVFALAGAQIMSAQTARTQPQGAGNNSPSAAGRTDLTPTGSLPPSKSIIPLGSKLTFGGTNAPHTYHAKTTFSSTPVLVDKGAVKIWQDEVATGKTGVWAIFHMETANGGPLAGNISADWNIMMSYELREAVYFDSVVTQFAVNGTPVSPLTDFGTICCATSSNPILPGEAYYNTGFQVALAKGRQNKWEEIYIDPYSFCSSGGINPQTTNQLTFALHFTRQKTAASDLPDVVTDANPGTRAVGTNLAGPLTRSYLDANGASHGFVPAADGTTITFDAPGAGKGEGQGTFAPDGNAAGAIAGYFIDAGGVNHGFLRAAGGAITAFDAPDAGTGARQGTFGVGVNMTGEIAGYYIDASSVLHGFVRAADGTITSFDAPGAGVGAHQGTVGLGINSAGDAAGYYIDANGARHGFARAPGGAVISFDAPGAGTAADRGTVAYGIDAAGVITGGYVDAVGVNHGFVRARSGAITEYQGPGAGAGRQSGT